MPSQIGIGSGGLWGTGLLHGYLTRLCFIPEQHIDFILSAMGEETGFIDSVLLIVASVMLLHRLLQIAGRARGDVGELCGARSLRLRGPYGGSSRFWAHRIQAQPSSRLVWKNAKLVIQASSSDQPTLNAVNPGLLDSLRITATVDRQGV